MTSDSSSATKQRPQPESRSSRASTPDTQAPDIPNHENAEQDPYFSSLHLFSRFRQSGDLTDLQQAVVVLEELGRASSVLDDRARQASLLRIALSYQFDYIRDLSDLDESISRRREAVDRTPDGHPDKPVSLIILGNSLTARLECLGEPSDLDEAILRYREAIELTPHGHPDKPSRLSNLGDSLFTRFEQLGKLGDLEEAVSRHRDANDLTPHGHPDKPTRLNTLGIFFRHRFDRLGDLNDLQEAISRQKNAVGLVPRDHPDKPTFLNSLGTTFFTRFDRLGELADIGEAVSSHKDALDLTPHGHPDEQVILNGLGNSFLARFENFGGLSDLEEAISSYSRALDLTPHGDPGKPGRLNNLGNSFYARFERLGELGDLEEAISKQKGAIDLTPPGSPDKVDYLNNLSISLSTRFQRLGELSDLEEAISRQKNVVERTPPDHPNKPNYLNSLANSFFARFMRFGGLSNLEEAMSMQKDAVDLSPDDHPEKPVHLNCLGNSYKARFERLGELRDLEEAIVRHRAAVDLTPDGHPDKVGRLGNLGNSFLARFERLGEPSDLEEAISRCKDAVSLIPHGHPDKPSHLSNLGNSLVTRFEHLGELRDLEEAISNQKAAVDLMQIPQSHPDRLRTLNTLSISLFARFQHLEDHSDLEEAISRQKNVVELTTDGHANKPAYLDNLGSFFLARFERVGEPSDLEQALTLHSQAASASIGPITIRFRASRKWISSARRIGHHSLLQAYSVSISLLPQLAWIGLPLSRRFDELVRGADVVREAAAAALDSGLPETAVEWLEQGRSIVWGELFQLRSSYEELFSVHPDQARRLRELSVALEQAGATRERSQNVEYQHRVTETLQQEADRYLVLAIERDTLLAEIRELPGFERFLLHKEFSQLRASAHSGPVVILNAAESRCDALVVRTEMDRVTHVPLSDFPFERSSGLQRTLKNLLGGARAIPCLDDSERVGKRSTRGGVSWESLLSVLWKSVVKPVLDALDLSTPEDPSRMLWCPTGPFVFLPLHGAGLYGTQYSDPGHKLSDFVISSYVPTLGILAPSSDPDPDAAPNASLNLLAVLQPPSDGLPRLPGVEKELEHIKTIITNTPSSRMTLLESSSGTVEEVFSLMKDADWVHFACHGIQDATNPTESGLCLADGRRLKISNIIALSRPRGGLAFLSACQTAMGDEGLSDEAIHIAAGMLFAGYGGVIGTMWSISDRLAPHVARDVYKELFRDGSRPDYRGSARALHEAIGRLRDSGASFDKWLPFIHVGL